MASKRKIQVLQPEVPSFLKKFKERVGYKEPSSVDDKFADIIENNSDDKREVEDDKKDDESPVIVVVKKGDMTAEEVVEYTEEQSEKEKCWDTMNDKPVFKKPAKRTANEKDTKNNDSKKKKANDKVKKIKNTKLLSFDEEDEDG